MQHLNGDLGQNEKNTYLQCGNNSHFYRGDAYVEQSKQCASLEFFSRKTVTLLLITIYLLLRVHLKDSSVFFALKNIKRFESYKR